MLGKRVLNHLTAFTHRDWLIGRESEASDILLLRNNENDLSFVCGWMSLTMVSSITLLNFFKTMHVHIGFWAKSLVEFDIGQHHWHRNIMAVILQFQEQNFLHGLLFYKQIIPNES